MLSGRMTTGTFDEAVALQRAGRHAAAAVIYRALAGQGRRDWSLLHNLGWALYRAQDAGCVDVLAEALTLAPDRRTASLALAHALRFAGRFAEAEPLYRTALELGSTDPDAREALAHVVLAQGRFAEGFRLLDERPSRLSSPGFGLGLPEWRGEPLAGRRLLVLAEQGFGDQIQFARWLPSLGAAAISYVGPPELARLFAALPVDYVATPPGGRFEVGPQDVWTLPMSLPARLGITEPTGEAYLPGAGAGLGTGLVWRGSPHHRHDVLRSLPADLAGDLLSLPGVVSLSPEDTGAKDFADTAAVIAELERVVTVDTSVAHLAGAMGKPVWILLPRLGQDWRWMSGRSDSPWYASARLFREADGGWAGVVAGVAAALRAA